MELSGRGYVSKPQAKETKAGKKYSLFTISVVQKNKKPDGTLEKTRAFFNATNWNESSPPEEGAFVTFKGYLNVRDYTDKTGAKRQSLDLNVQELEVAPPREGAAQEQKPAEKEPWDD